MTTLQLTAVLQALAAHIENGQPFDRELHSELGGCEVKAINAAMKTLAPSWSRHTRSEVVREARRLRRNLKNKSYQAQTRERRRMVPIPLVEPSFISTVERMLTMLHMPRTKRRHAALLHKLPLKIVFKPSKKPSRAARTNAKTCAA